MQPNASLIWNRWKKFESYSEKHFWLCIILRRNKHNLGICICKYSTTIIHPLHSNSITFKTWNSGKAVDFAHMRKIWVFYSKTYRTKWEVSQKSPKRLSNESNVWAFSNDLLLNNENVSGVERSNIRKHRISYAKLWAYGARGGFAKAKLTFFGCE